MTTAAPPPATSDAVALEEPAIGVRRQRTIALDETRLNRSVLELAWPVLVQQLALSLVQLVDTFLVGHLGSDALAGVGIATFIQYTPQAGAFAITAGTTAVLARDMGAGQHDRASATLRHGLLIAAVWGILSSFAIFVAAHWSLSVMGTTGGALDSGTRWLQFAAPGVAASALLFVATGGLQGAGDTRTPMVVMICVNVVNAVVAYTLIHGSFALPRLGVAGSGIGFSASQIAGMLLILAVLTPGRGGLKMYWPAFLHIDREIMRRILKVGLPAGMEQIQFQFAMLVYTHIIAGLGTTALAAHSVAIRIQGLAFLPGMAFSQAATAITGQALGAGNSRLAERAAFSATRFAFIALSCVAVLLALFGGPITRAFIDDPAVTDVGRRLLMVFAVAQPAIAVTFTLSGALRGAGDTRAVMLISSVSPWLVRVVLAYFLAVVLGWGVAGAWLGAVADMWVRAILIAIRFQRGRWKAIRV